MSTREDHWPYGTPSWVSLVSTDRPMARAFYAAVLGWQYRVARGDPDGYTIAMLRTKPVAGIDPRPRRQPAWITHLATDDVAKVCGSARSAAGRVLAPPRDVGREARTALLADPTGAVFGLWQGRETIGAEVVNEPGALVWNECLTRDAAAAREFYTAILDYRYAPLEGPADYTLIARRGEWRDQPRAAGHGPGGAMGGIAAIEPGAPAQESAWQTHFGVEDVDEAAQDVLLAGGQVVLAPHRGRHGRLAQCSDPDGARFWIVQVQPGG